MNERFASNLALVWKHLPTPWRLALALVLASPCLLLVSVTRMPARPDSTVAVAASLRTVMPEVLREFQARGGGPVALTYGASGDLRKQVEGGAPIDAVIFASGKPVDALQRAGLLEAETRATVASNRLVLIGPKGSAPVTFATLDRLPAGERLAIGDPGAVPAGQYAVEALERLGKWEAMDGRLVYGGDVAGVLAYARRGEVAAAIVYATEARSIPDIVVHDEASGAWSPRAEVVAAATKRSGGGTGRALVKFLASAEGQAILRRHGFGPP